MYVVTVLFEINTQHAELFRDAIMRNAAASLSDEPGCRRFDVCFSEDGARCFLYEIYDDRAAFEAHMQTPHFREFGETAEEMIARKQLETFTLANNPYADRSVSPSTR